MANDKKTMRRREPRFELIAGNLCLDFINTLDDRFSKEPKELLAKYVDLARFAEDTQILSEQQVDRLFALSQEFQKEAARALRAAVQLREAAYAVIWAAMKKKAAPRGELTLLNQYIQVAAQHSSLVEVNGGRGNGAKAGGKFAWEFDWAPNNLEQTWWPIARAAAELLASDQLELVRACASETCQWLFLDTSKNHGRVWCDMSKCGNRAKARAFYERKKKG